MCCESTFLMLTFLHQSGHLRVHSCADVKCDSLYGNCEITTTGTGVGKLNMVYHQQPALLQTVL